MNPSTVFLRVIGLVAVILMLTALPTARAQITTATLYGIAQDSSGAVLPAAKATLTNEGTHAARQVVADSKGEFSFQFVPVGTYTLRIEAAGFRVLESPHVEITAAQQTRTIYTLEIGQMTQEVLISAGAPLMNTVNAEQQENISTREIADLPVTRRTVSNLMSLGSGVVDTGLGRFDFNGLGQNATSFSMDGIDASGNPQAPQAQFKEGQNYIAIVSMEAVQEVQISKGVFSAEYARTMGGNINVITKSGTNQVHGGAFELFNSEELNARSQFLTSKPGTTFNQYGGSLGGPVRKDRIFLFGAYEGYQERTASVTSGNVPTPSLRAAMIAAVPAYKALLDLFPLPNQPFAAAAATGNYISPGSVSAGDNHFVVRPDVRISDRAMFTATYVHAAPNLITPRIQVTDPQLFNGTTNRVNLNFTYIWGPKWSSETRFGYNRNDRSRNDGFYSQVDTSQPETMPGGRRLAGISALGFGITGEYNIIGRAPHKSFDQKFSATVGRHSLKFGALVYWNEFGSDNIQNPTVTYQNQADLLANIPNAINMTFGRNDADGKAREFGAFIQDDFRVNSRLTLNLGLRYDYFGHFTADAPGQPGKPPHIYNIADLTFPNFTYTSFRPPDDPYDSDGLNLGPHVGFAYDAGGNSKTVVRGGFGVSFTPIAGEIVKNMVLNNVDEPFRSNFSRQDAQTLGLKYPVFNQDVLPLVKGKVASPTFPYLDPHSKAPYSMTYTLTVERALTSTVALETAFVATRGVKLQGFRYYNQPDRVTGLRPNQGLQSDIFFDNSDSSHYFGWQSSLRKRFSRGLLFNLHYTWGKAIAYNGGDIGFNTTYVQDFFNLRSNRGPSANDVRQSFVSDFVYRVPIFTSWRRNVAARTLLGGWEVSGIVGAHTGTPLLITEPNGLNGQRPDLVDPQHVILNSGLQYLNPAAFAQVPVSKVSGTTVRPGTLGNNAVYGPGAWNVDSTVHRVFTLAERYQLQFRADLLNAFNHTNFAGVSTNIQAATFGQYVSTAGSRRIQFGLRLGF